MVTGIGISVTKEKPYDGIGRKNPWRVDIPASLAGKRKRKFFASKREAENYAEDFLDGSMRGGVASVLEGQTVGQALTEYLEAKVGTVGDRQEGTLKAQAGQIRAKLGHLRLSVLTVRDVEKFVNRDGWAPRTRWNALSYLRTFLGWCQRREKIAKNPADLVSEEMRKPDSSLEILTVGEMRLLLHLTKRKPVMRAFVVLGAFAGLRSAEIMRIEWAAIDREEREIHVSPGVIKKTRGVRERYTTINVTCLRWLPDQGEGRVIPHTLRAFQRRTEKLIGRMQRLMCRLKMLGSERWHDWPQNCLRHSFASYLLAVKQDAGYVAYQMGHTSADMVHQTYARAVRKSEAERWWAI